MSTPTLLGTAIRRSLLHKAPARPQFRCFSNLPKSTVLQTRQWPATQVAKQQSRPASTFITKARELYRQYPFRVGLAYLCIVAGLLNLVYVGYFYCTYIIGQYHNYPEEVAKPLRRAVYYTDTELRPMYAIKYYRQAIETAAEIGMDPFSDEIMGIKLKVAFLMESIKQYDKAIEVLERIRENNLEWLARFGDLDHNKKKRTRILAKTIAISVKLGNLYADPAIWMRDMAEERLVWAVETALKEQQRRRQMNVKVEDEGEWISDEEHGAVLENLAHEYEAKDQHYLATPLFLQALNLYPTKDCHTVVLMNNLASSLAQQAPRAARAAQAFAESHNINERPVGPRATKETMLENARTWANKALAVAAAIQPSARTEECDVACAVATHNLAEFAEMSQNLDEARKLYAEAIALSRSIGFQEGVDNSSERLRKLKGLSG